MTFSIIYVEFSEVFNETKATLAWINSLQFGGGQVSGIFLSHVVKRYGTTVVIISGTLITSSGLLFAAFSNHLSIIIIGYGLLPGIGLACTFVSLPSVVNQYFEHSDKRPMALGFMSVGIVVSGMAFTPLVGYALQELGWRGALIILAGMRLHCIPLALIMRPTDNMKLKQYDENNNEVKGCADCKETMPCDAKNKEATSPDNLKLKPCYVNNNDDDDDTSTKHFTNCNEAIHWLKDFTDFSLLKNPRFSLFLFCTFGMNLGISTFIAHVPSKTIKQGFTMEQSTFFMSIFSFSNLARVLFCVIGTMSCFDRFLMYALGTFLSGLMCVAVGFGNSFMELVTFSVACGIFYSLGVSVQMVVNVDIVGVKNTPRGIAIMMISIALSYLAAPPLAGYMYDVTHDYSLPFYVMGGTQAVYGAITILYLILTNTRGTPKIQESRFSFGSNISLP